MSDLDDGIIDDTIDDTVDDTVEGVGDIDTKSSSYTGIIEDDADHADPSWTGIVEEDSDKQGSDYTGILDDNAPAHSSEAGTGGAAARVGTGDGTTEQRTASKTATHNGSAHYIYHLPAVNYVGRTKQADGKRWKQHEANHGRDITGATNISAVTASTEKPREAFHIGAKDAYHNGDNGNRGAKEFRPNYYQGKKSKNIGGSYSTSTAQSKPRE